MSNLSECVFGFQVLMKAIIPAEIDNEREWFSMVFHDKNAVPQKSSQGLSIEDFLAPY